MAKSSLSKIDPDLEQEARDLWQKWLELRGFEERPRQWEAIQYILSCLQDIPALEEGEDDPEEKNYPENGAICAIEAPTGTGKTLAYLLAGLLCAQRTGRKLVVVTSTLALQRQIIEKELPTLLEAGKLDSSYKIAQGRQRYLCLLRAEAALSNLRSDAGQVSMYADGDITGMRPERVDLYQSLVHKARNNKWDGDWQSWQGEKLQAQEQRSMSINSEACLRHNCPEHRRCSYYRALYEWQQADCVITNHHLMLSNMKTGDGEMILPSAREHIYILDEAHRFGETTCNQYGSSVGLNAFREGLGEMGKEIEQMSKKMFEEGESSIPELDTLATHVTELIDVYTEIGATLGGEMTQPSVRYRIDNDVYLFEDRLPPRLRELADAALERCNALMDIFTNLGNEIPADTEEDASQEQQPWSARWSGFIGGVRTQTALWHSYISWTEREDDEMYFDEPAETNGACPPQALWFEKKGKMPDVDYHLYARPTQAVDDLAPLWEDAAGIVMTSASMDLSDSLRHFQHSLGLPQDSALHVLGATFDYKDAAQLVLPKMQSKPTDSGFAAEAAEYLEECVLENDGGSLVLFGSYRQMEEVYELFTAEAHDVIQIQRSGMSVQRLLEQHRRRIDEGKPSALFGVAGLAEGIDLPGDYCTQVVITRIPFAPPNTPRMRVLESWYKKRGGSVFNAVSVPEAGLLLKQWCGRLLRSVDDSGRIVILDNRIRNQGYGKVLLGMLPDYERVYE